MKSRKKFNEKEIDELIKQSGDKDKVKRLIRELEVTVTPLAKSMKWP